MTTTASITARGTVDGVPVALTLQFLGGPTTFTIESGEFTLNQIIDLFRDALQKVDVNLPQLPQGPWSSITNSNIKPAIVLSPGAETSAARAEFEFDPPIKIGGKIVAGIYLEPEIKILNLYVEYDKGQGLNIKARVLFLNQQQGGPPRIALGNGDQGVPKVVGFPFPLPAQKKPAGFEVKYLGLGQRFGVNVDLSEKYPIQAALDALIKQLSSNDPVAVLNTLAKKYYHPDRNWYVAADIVLRGFEIRFIFNDPDLYGLMLSASLGKLSGLSLTILYQKLGPRLGVYYADLSIPTAYRTIILGSVTITLPSISIWIYTNGDFKVNVGWPLGDRSIVIQFNVFIGGGGFYFAKLRSADDPGVVPSGANYNPILAFGLAVFLGVGRQINAGPVSAALTLTLQGTFQGVLAWQAPEGGAGTLSKPPDNYWFAATVSLVGLLQGQVDLAVIKISISIRLSVTAGVAFQLQYRTVVSVEAEVSVRAKVKIAFFSIHVKFRAKISHQFVIGSGAENARLEGPQPPLTTGPGTAKLPVPPLVLKTLSQRDFFGRYNAQADPLFNDKAAATPLKLSFALHPSIVYPQDSAAQVEAVASLFIAIPPPEESSSEKQSRGVDEVRSDYQRLVERLQAWLLKEFSDGTNHWAVVQKNLGQGLSGAPSDFYGKLTAFLQTFAITIEGVNLSAAGQAESSVAVFPMLPQLQLAYPQAGGEKQVAFDYYANPQPGTPSAEGTPPDYLQVVEEYFDQLSLNQLAVSGGTVQKSGRTLSMVDDNHGPSIAHIALEDYFLMVCRQIANENLTSDDSDIELARKLAGIGSRFLLNGMRLPDPESTPPVLHHVHLPDLKIDGIYRLTQQQFAATGKPHDAFAASLSLSPNAEVPPDWITFSGDGGATTSSFSLGDAPAAPQVDWVVSTVNSPLQPGKIQVSPAPSISARPLWFAVRNRIAWTHPDDSRGQTATSAIVPLPESITDLAQSSKHQSGVRLIVTTTSPEVGQDLAQTNLAGSSSTSLLIWLTANRVNRAASMNVDPQGHPDPYYANTYQIGGTDDETRRLIEQAIDSDLSGAKITILYGDGEGKVKSDPLAADPDAVLLYKTNLSTSTQPAAEHLPFPMLLQLAADGDVRGPTSATYADVKNFLQLLWQASVVHAAGYFLHYTNQSGNGLPDSIFDGAAGKIGVLVDFAADPGLVQAHQNALVVDQDLAGKSLFVQVQDAQTSKPILQWQPNYPAGCVAFEIDWMLPLADADPYSPATVAAAYQLIEFRINGEADSASDAPVFEQSLWSNTLSAETYEITITSPEDGGQVSSATVTVQGFVRDKTDQVTVFDNSGGAHPATVLKNGGFAAENVPIAAGAGGNTITATATNVLGEAFSTHIKLWRESTPPPTTADSQPSTFRSIVPVYRFVAQQDDDTKAKNRYAAAGGNPKLEFRLANVYGNLLVSDSHQQTFAARYHDPLLAPDQWPGVQIGFRFESSATAGQATLKILVDFDLHTVLGDDQILINTPLNGSEVSSSPVTVAGSVRDAAVDEIVVNGQSTPVDKETGAFQATVELSPGENVIEAEVTNKSDLKTSVSVAYKPKQAGGSAAADVAPTGDTFKSQAQSALAQYSIIADQLADAATTISPDKPTRLKITSSLTGDADLTAKLDVAARLADFVGNVQQQLHNVVNGDATSPVSSATIDLAVTFAQIRDLADDVFPITVAFTMWRDKYVDPFAATRLPSASKVSFSISPDLRPPHAEPGAADDPADVSLRAFAQEFEQAFTGFDEADGLLKLAQRSKPREGNGAAQAVALWGLRWSKTHGVYVKFPSAAPGGANSSAPVYFAPAPLSTALLQGQFEVTDYDSQLKPTPRRQNFNGVDLDQWARAFLSAFDSALQPEIAAAIAKIDPDSFKKQLDCKQTLAYCISRSVIHVYQQQAETNAGDLEKARDRFEQSLLLSLSSDYATSAIVQAPAEVTTHGANGNASPAAPRFFGSVGLPSIAITAPLDGASVQTATIDVAGVVAMTGARVTVNGKDAVVTANRFQAQGVPLTVGQNTITAVAEFNTRESASTSIRITRLASAFHSQLAAIPAGTEPPPAEYSFTSSRLTMAPGAAGEPQWLTFLVSVADPGASAVLQLPLRYDIGFLEHQFEAGEGANYVASSWLKFIETRQQSVLDQDIGLMKIPIPVRRFPQTPLFVSQQAATGVSIASPEAGARLPYAQKISVLGAYSGGFSKISVAVNGDVQQPVSVYPQNRTFSAQVQLVEGPNTITVTAADPLTHIFSTAEVQVTGVQDSAQFALRSSIADTIASVLRWNYAFAVRFPNQRFAAQDELWLNAVYNEPLRSPIIVIVNPVDGQKVKQPQVTVYCKAVESAVDVTINGQPAAYENGSYQAVVHLEPGWNTIRARAALQNNKEKIEYAATPVQVYYEAAAASADDEPPGPPAGDVTRLFGALAGFMTAYPAIRPLLGRLPGEAFGAGAATNETGPPAAAVIAAWLELVSNVAAGWQAFAVPEENAQAAPLEFADSDRLQRVVKNFVVSFRHIDSEELWVYSPDNDAANWPVINGQPPKSIADKPAPPGVAPGPGVWYRAKYDYQPLADTPPGTLIFEWLLLDVLQLQTGIATYWVKRNADIQGVGDDFVYQTVKVEPANPAIPLIDVPKLGPLEGESTLADSLTPIFTPFLRAGRMTDQRLLKASFGYAVPLSVVKDDPQRQLMAPSSILLVNDLALDPDSEFVQDPLDDFVQNASREISDWHRATDPVDEGAILDVAVTLFATVSDSRLPLVRLGNVAIYVTESWWPKSAGAALP